MLDVSVRALAARDWYRAVATVRLSSMLIAQLSNLHVGGARHEASLLRAVIEEVNAAAPDLVVIAGDVSDEGYPDQYELATDQLAGLACERVVIVPGNHDARHVGYLQFERIFGARDVRLRLTAGDTDPRTWPAELSNLYVEPFVPAERGAALAND